MPKILKIDNISKSYGKKSVIHNVDLQIKQGEIVGLLGPNGAGKTTCFYMIVGLVDNNSGKILIDDVDISKMPIYQRASLGISYLPQESSIFSGMSVEKNIEAVLEISEPNKYNRQQKLIFNFSHQKLSCPISIWRREKKS